MSEEGGLNELALFAGAGGGILGGKLLGWRTVCAVEINPYCAGVLVRRQNEGYLDPFPVWDDVCSFDGKPWRGIVDVVSGGFPCVDISPVGKKRGIAGKHSGLWKEMARIIGEVQPRYAFVENSGRLVRDGLSVVLADLACLGYDARWGVVGASDAGADHNRKRTWIVANAQWCTEQDDARRRESKRVGWAVQPVPWDRPWKRALHELRGMDDGLAHHVDRTDAIRNGQVPAVVRLAWNIIKEGQQ